MRIAQAVIRVKPLGRDRFWNRYWWFDGPFGAYPFEAVTQGHTLVPGKLQKLPVNEGVLQDWASGMIFVEDFNLKAAFTEQEGIPDTVKFPVVLGETQAKWGFYSTTQEVFVLRCLTC